MTAVAKFGRQAVLSKNSQPHQNLWKTGSEFLCLNSFCIPKQQQGKFQQADMQNAHVDTSTAAHKAQRRKTSSYSQLHQGASRMHLLCLAYTTESYLILILCFMYRTSSLTTMRQSDAELVGRLADSLACKRTNSEKPCAIAIASQQIHLSVRTLSAMTSLPL